MTNNSKACESWEEGTDQESIQSSNTLYRKVTNTQRIHHIQESQEVSLLVKSPKPIICMTLRLINGARKSPLILKVDKPLFKAGGFKDHERFVIITCSCADPERFVRKGLFYIGSKYRYKWAIIRPPVKMAFSWRADDRPTLNAGLVALRCFRGSGPVLLRNPIYLGIFQWGPGPPPPPPLNPCIV